MELKNKNFVEKTINLLLNVLIFIFGIILLISIYTGVQTKVLGNDYTDFFGYSIFEVQTGSMADVINAGDWIIVKLSKKIDLNDIVTYKLNDDYITHRVIEVYNGTYITQGDANSGKDKPVDQNQIIGKVVKIFTNFGIIRKTLFNPSVLITLIITLFLFELAVKKNKAENKKRSTSKNTKIQLYLEIIKKKVTLFIEKLKGIKNDKKMSILINNLINKFKKNHLKKERVEKNISLDMEKKVIDRTEKIYNFDDFDEEPEEDELDKTSFYRVIEVDSNEVGEKEIEAVQNHKIEEPEEDDLDKTSMYRVISVDTSDINANYNQSIEKEPEKVKKTPKKELVQEEDKEPGLTKIDLELLKNKKFKKSKNIVDSAMIIKREELNELINVLVKDNKSYVNKATIKEMFITVYIDAKYYNYYGEKDIEYTGENLILKIKNVIESLAKELISDYKGNDNKYSEIVDTYTNIFILIADLDNAKDSITDTKNKKDFYEKKLNKYLKDEDNQNVGYLMDEIMKIQVNYVGILKYFIKKLETNTFDLKFNKISARKKMYGLELEHNISFSKVYSDYIIDKTYTEGLIAEDKMPILFTLLLVQVINDMLTTKFNNKYILYMPKSLYAKEKKLQKILNMINNEYAKNNIIILITFNDLLNNKQIIKKNRKIGYKFALVFEEDTVFKDKDRGNIYIADYIFINKNDVNKLKILSFMPEELLSKVVYENIIDKVGDFGSD